MNEIKKENIEDYWYPIALRKDVGKKPQTFILLGRKLVVYLGKSGLVAQKDCCPHRKYPLSAGKVKNGQLQCGYHGWQFDGKGFLTVLPGSDKVLKRRCSALTTYSIYEHEDLIWVCLRENQLFSPFQKNLQSQQIFSYKSSITGDIRDILENFLDPLHTSYLHDGLIRSQKKKNRTFAEIRAIENGVEIKYTEESHQSGIIGEILGRSIVFSYGRLTKPNIIDIEFHSHNGIEMTNRFIVVPTHKNENLFFSQITFRKTCLPNWLKFKVLTPLFLFAFRQDKVGLKRQEDNLAFFKENEINSTFLDIMRPYIDKIQDGEEFQVDEHTIEMYL